MDTKKVNGSGNGSASNEWRVKVGLAEMLKGGVIMDVTNAEQAKSRSRPGPAPSRPRTRSLRHSQGRRGRMASIKAIREIMRTVTIP